MFHERNRGAIALPLAAGVRLEANYPVAIACGTPCVGFNIGGIPEMIEHQQNGYLARPYEIEDLARGIAWVLENRERHQKLSLRAREKAEQEFTQEIQARRYLSIFTEILSRGKP